MRVNVAREEEAVERARLKQLEEELTAREGALDKEEGRLKVEVDARLIAREVLINHASLGTPRGRFEEHSSKFSLS